MLLEFIHSLFIYPNYTIDKVTLEYQSVLPDPESPDEPFWREESKYWDVDQSWHHADVTKIWRSGRLHMTVPKNVQSEVLRIRYWFGGKKYNYFTYNLNCQWPPKKEGLSLPNMVSNVFLLDHDGSPVRNVTKKFLKAAGPYGDFFKQPVTPSMIFSYNDYTAVRIHRDPFLPPLTVGYSSSIFDAR